MKTADVYTDDYTSSGSGSLKGAYMFPISYKELSGSGCPVMNQGNSKYARWYGKGLASSSSYAW